MFLRKKVKQDAPPHAPVRTAPESAIASPTPPPLFARFATNQSSDGQQRPMVSGPMALNARKDSYSKPIPSQDNRIGTNPGRKDERGMVSKPFGNQGLTGNRDLDSHLSSSLPSHAGTPDASRARQSLPASKLHVPAQTLTEKPLPPTLPSEEPHDILSSPPPTSSLPINRRISNSQPAPRFSSVVPTPSEAPVPVQSEAGHMGRRISTVPSSASQYPSRDSSIPPRATNTHPSRVADNSGPQTLLSSRSSTRKSSAQDLHRKESANSYSAHVSHDTRNAIPDAEAVRDNFVTRPTPSVPSADPPSSFRSFNNYNTTASASTSSLQNSYNGPSAGPNDSFNPYPNTSTDQSNMGASHSSMAAPFQPPFKGMAAPAVIPSRNPPPQMIPHVNAPPFDMSRRASTARPSEGPTRGKPLIFAAMTTVQQPQDSTSPTLKISELDLSRVSSPPLPPPPSRHPSSAYPSPPADYSSPPPKFAPLSQQDNHHPPASSTRRQSTRDGHQTVSSDRRSSLMKAQPPLPPPNQSLPSSNPHRRSMLHKNGHQAVEDGVVSRRVAQGAPAPAPVSTPDVHHAQPHHAHGSPHRTLTKSRPQPATPKHQNPNQNQNQVQQRPTPPVSPEIPKSAPARKQAAPLAPAIISNAEFEAGRRVAIPLDDDPFARADGVRMIKPSSRDGLPPSREGLSSRDGLSSREGPSSRDGHSSRECATSREGLSSREGKPVSVKDAPVTREAGKDRPSSQVHDGSPPKHEPSAPDESSSSSSKDHEAVGASDAVEENVSVDNADMNGSASMPNGVSEAHPVDESRSVTPPQHVFAAPRAPLTPPSPDQYRNARSRRRGGQLERPSTFINEIPMREDRPAEPFPLVLYLSDPNLLSSLLSYLSYFDWCNLFSVSKKIRTMLVQNELLREEVLERFLRTVGYSRWIWREPEPLTLSLTDLHDYMRGVSVPTFEYARVAELVLQQRSILPSIRDASITEKARLLVSATRAYNRVLLRLRAQAEREPSSLTNGSPQASQTHINGNNSPRSPPSASRSSSRAPSPTSSFTHGRSTNHSHNGHDVSRATPGFRSPLFRPGRAPLLRVFVASPEGDWLSDASVLQCEAELKRAEILGLMRLGDVVWDMAVGDEGNAGRLIWDGSYLIDLDYTYSTIGDLPKYIPALAFPPSYFHRVIRTGPSSSNPVIRLDVAPWGSEVAANLQLLQDRVRTETPQGAHHHVVRWVHRSSFALRPPMNSRRSPSHVRSGKTPASRIPIPDSNNLFVDPGWYGKIVVETEGTNEALADLQDRCGPGAFPPRVTNATGRDREKECKTVFRIIRDRSRPGEIWVRAVGPKEKIM